MTKIRLMRTRFTSRHNLGLALVLFSVLFSACVTNRSLVYMRDRDKQTKSFEVPPFDDYKIKPNDDLFISITSLDDASSANFFSNSASSQMNRSIDQFGASLLSHTVDKDGYLEMPVIGKILVKEKTLAQVKVMINEKLVGILNQPVVSVKLVNKFVAVIGEVRNPGHFSFTQDKLTIYDAVSLAGDITDYGDRKQVTLIRSEKGKNVRVNLNLAKPEILSSQYYYLYPNDIVYVKPLRKKFWGFREFPFASLLSAVSTTILVLNYVNNNR